MSAETALLSDPTFLKNPKPTLEDLRQTDPVNKEGYTDEEHQTLNFSRIRNFFNKSAARPGEKPLNANDFDQRFTLEMGIALTNLEKSPSGRKIHTALNYSQKVLSVAGQPNLLNEPSSDAFFNALDAAVKKEALQPLPHPLTENRSFLEYSYHLLAIIRNYGKESLRVSEDMKSLREEQKPDYRKDIVGWVKDFASNVAERWKEWPKEQRIAFAGAGLVGIIMLATSTNKTMEKIRNFGIKAFKVLGGAGLATFVMDSGIELVSGASPINYLYDATKSNINNPHFWEGIYGENGAEKITKGLMIEEVRNAPMVPLLQKYKEAVSSGSNKISGVNIPNSKMSEEELFQAMDAFVGQTTKNNPQMAHLDNLGKANALIKKYAGWKTPATFGEVVSAELTEQFKVEGNLGERTTEKARNFFVNSYNYLASTDAVIWLQEQYKKYFGKDPDPKALLAFKERFGYCVDKSDQVESTIEQKITSNKQISDAFKMALGPQGKYDAKNNVHYFENSQDGYTYIVAKRNIANSMGTEQMLKNAIQDTADQSEGFIANRYQLEKKKAGIGMEPLGSIHVIENATFHYLARIKTPATSSKTSSVG